MTCSWECVRTKKDNHESRNGLTLGKRCTMIQGQGEGKVTEAGCLILWAAQGKECRSGKWTMKQS